LTRLRRDEAQMSLCKISDEVLYLFYEKIHVLQKVTLFMGDGQCLFLKGGV
jgi:hypothetical protein